MNQTGPVLHRAVTALQSEPDLRQARDGAPGLLKTVEGFLLSSPQNRQLLKVTSQGYAAYAFGFLEDDIEALPEDRARDEERRQFVARATGMYERSLAFALRDLDRRVLAAAGVPKVDLESTSTAQTRP